MKALAMVGMLVGFGACGGDDGGGTTPPPAAAGAPAPGAPVPGAGSGKPLTPMVHIEDRVQCPVPQRVQDLPPAADRCDATTVCKDRAKPYCLTVPVSNNNSYCLPCNERDNIRHPFKDRDFVGDPSQNRDPFQSYILAGAGTGSADKPVVEANQPKCVPHPNNNFGSVSYQDLKLFGISVEGTQRAALCAAGRTSFILRRNDCAGRENALVKEVGVDYITFVAPPDQNAVANSTAAKPVEFTVQLHTSLALNSIESPPSDQPSVPQNVVPPPTKIAPPTRIVPPPTKTTIPPPTNRP